MFKKIIIIQARLGSHRLPEKVMAKIRDYTLIEILSKQLDGLKQKGFEIAYAIPRDDFALKKYLEGLNQIVVQGSEENVFSRFQQVIEQYQPDAAVRITGDCPFIDPDVIFKMCEDFIKNELDYITNDEQYGGMPRGFDCEIIARKAWDRMAGQCLSARNKEHCTSYIIDNRNEFKTGLYSIHLPKAELKGIRLCVDTQQDLDYVRDICKRLGDFSFPIFHDRIIDLIRTQSLWR